MCKGLFCQRRHIAQVLPISKGLWLVRIYCDNVGGQAAVQMTSLMQRPLIQSVSSYQYH